MKQNLLAGRSPLSRLSRHLKGKAYSKSRFFILVDENTYTHCLPTLVAAVEPLQEAEFIEVPAGEECKDIAIAQQLWLSLAESGADRQSVIVNLGGGSICDLGGFVASTYMRGIRHINVPTTLLAMVDAAIGGKTALNLDGTKNLVGTFHQPAAVCIEPSFLDTLPEEQLCNGSAEMIKTLLVSGDMTTLPTSWLQLIDKDLIARCAEVKKSLVELDPTDLSQRHVLNLGHTFGHAIEAYSHAKGDSPLPHGIAVALGMLPALYLSTKKVGLSPTLLSQYQTLVATMTPLPHYTLHDTEPLLQLMHRDKKNANGEVLCILLQEPGATMIDVEVSDLEIRDALLATLK